MIGSFNTYILMIQQTLFFNSNININVIYLKIISWTIVNYD